MAHLTGATIVRNPADQQLVVLQAGQEVPEWAADQVGDHLLGGAGASTPTEGSSSGADKDLTEPPRAGRGSGVDAWKAYAESLDIEVPDGAQRDDIVELVDQHNQS